DTATPTGTATPTDDGDHEGKKPGEHGHHKHDDGKKPDEHGHHKHDDGKKPDEHGHHRDGEYNWPWD
ncbi:hypothetical protein ACF1GS_39795, partial [Streptomyces eurythermus]